MSNNTQYIEASAATASKAASAMYAGGGTSLFALVMSIDWLAVIGALFAIVGFIANNRYQRKKNKREQLEFEARMKREDELHKAKLKKLEGGYNE